MDITIQDFMTNFHDVMIKLDDFMKNIHDFAIFILAENTDFLYSNLA